MIIQSVWQKSFDVFGKPVVVEFWADWVDRYPIVSLEDGQTDVPTGAIGELIVKGPQVMKGYWPDAGNGLTDDGWLHTGDIGFMDEDGYFYISDRIKDMVNVSGMKVYTTTVDEVLFKHPGVLMAAAFGVPDPKNPGSERVMAVIKLKEEAVGMYEVAVLAAGSSDALKKWMDKMLGLSMSPCNA